MLINASVIGTARAFIHEEDVIGFFVERHEEAVREKSDKAWAKVRAEQEEKAHVEREKARREAAKTAAANPSATIADLTRPFALTFDFSDIMPKYNFDFMPKAETVRHGGARAAEAVVLRDVNLDEVKVTYKATAHGYGDVFEGEPITVPIEKVNMFESFQAAFEASKEGVAVCARRTRQPLSLVGALSRCVPPAGPLPVAAATIRRVAAAGAARASSRSSRL